MRLPDLTSLSEHLARRGTLVLALLLPLLPALASAQAPPPAQSHAAGSLTVSGAWARATPPNARTGAAYLTIANKGPTSDRLTAAASPAARAAELHTHAMEGGVARMRPVDAVEIAAGESAIFQPGGLHVMLIDLAAPLREGQSLALTLNFEKAGAVTVEVPIRRTPPAAAPGHSSSHGH